MYEENYTYLLKKWSDPISTRVKIYLYPYEKVRVRVRSSKNEVRCASACETIIKVRVCVRHTVKSIATQRLREFIQGNLFLAGFGYLEPL